MVKNKNFMGQVTPSIIDIEYQNCNFHQTNCTEDGGQKKGVRLFPGDDTPRTFVDCNMVNCEPPPGSTQTRCNCAIIERDIVDTDEEVLVIDGTPMRASQLKDVRYGKFENGVYLYFSTPKEHFHRRLV